jgi:hypothetical protein
MRIAALGPFHAERACDRSMTDSAILNFSWINSDM